MDHHGFQVGGYNCSFYSDILRDPLPDAFPFFQEADAVDDDYAVSVLEAIQDTGSGLRDEGRGTRILCSN